MNLNELNPKIETKEKELETYTDFKKRYYIYRADDIREYLQRDNTELNNLYEQEQNIFSDLQKTLSPEQQKILLHYSDNWFDLLNVEIDELTQYILKDFEDER